MLISEVKALAPDSMAIKTIAPSERKYSVWIGAQYYHNVLTFCLFRFQLFVCEKQKKEKTRRTVTVRTCVTVVATLEALHSLKTTFLFPKKVGVTCRTRKHSLVDLIVSIMV